MKTLYLFYTALFLALTACATSQKEEPVTVLAHQTVEIKNDYIGMAIQLLIVGDRLYGADMLTDTCLFCIDLTKNEMYRFGAKGQGANDFVMPYSLQYLDENRIGVYDMPTRKYCEVDLKSGYKVIKRSPQLMGRATFAAHCLPDGRYLGIGSYENSMFTLYNTTGTAQKEFYEYPYKNKEDKSIKNHLRAMAYQGKFCSNPSKNKFVYAASFSDILHFYQWDGDSLKIILKIENSYPEYTPEESGGGFGAAMDKDKPCGYLSAYATEQFVYVLYSGDIPNETIMKGINFSGDQLFVYNWKGEKVKAIKLDIRCTMIAVSPDDEILYAIANNPDPELERFDLKSVPGLGKK